MNEKRMLRNKGFSLVELIFVIAIMAILVGVLAPQYMKYLDKTRKATDVQTAQTIATAVNVALASEATVGTASTQTIAKLYTDAATASGTAFQKEVADTLGANEPKPKFSPSIYATFNIVIVTDPSTGAKTAEIHASKSDGSDGKMLYPTVVDEYK